MRSAKFFTVLGLVLLLSLSLLVVGCGSDKGTTSLAGSLTDPEFVAVQGQIESLVDSTLGFVLTGMNSLSSISSGGNVDPILYGPVFSDSDQVTISYVNGWHIVSLTKSTADYALNIYDSVQFYSNDALSQTGVGSDSMWYRHNWTYDVADKAVSYTTFDGSAGFDYRGLNANQATIDGTNDLTVNDKFISVDSTVTRQFIFSTEVTNLTINSTPTGWDQACPNGGTITSTVSMSYTKDEAAAVVSNWTVTMTFTDGAAAISVRSGDVVWQYNSDVCIAIN